MSGTGDPLARRVVVVPGGPLLVEGPLEVVLPDGTVRICDRPVVALCACRRSRRHPFCDTSHRHRRREPGPESGRESGPESGAEPAGPGPADRRGSAGRQG